MTERGLIFTGDSIPGLQSGVKTQSRRVIRPQPPDRTENGTPYTGFQSTTLPISEGYDLTAYLDNPRYIGKCPYGRPGDHIWVRETWAKHGSRPGSLHYRASATEADLQWLRKEGVKWRSPRFMPKKYARVWLELTGVRVERLQAISSGDALAEGVAKTVFWQPKEVDENPKPTHEWAEPYWDDHHFFSHYPQRAFSKLWDSLNVKRGFPWSGNWWVWVLEFRLLEGKRSG